MIRLTHVSKTFDEGRSFAVKDLSFQVEKGETLVLLGSSGCGKTTTLKMINRLIEASSGIIEVNGKDIRDQAPVDLRRRMGYVFQKIGFFPPYYAAPVIRKDLLQDHPEVGHALSRVGGLIDDAHMQRLNFEVDAKGQGPADAAKEFLRTNGLI